MNITSIIRLFFAVCFPFLGNFPQSAQAEETKRVYFAYGEHPVTVCAIAQHDKWHTFNFGATMREKQSDGQWKQFLDIGTGAWQKIKDNDQKIVFEVKTNSGMKKKFREVTVGELRDASTVLDFAKTKRVYFAYGEHPVTVCAIAQHDKWHTFNFGATMREKQSDGQWKQFLDIGTGAWQKIKDNDQKIVFEVKTNSGMTQKETTVDVLRDTGSVLDFC
ncbi:hypothetical protein niasHT_014321 [Heterodera trifolii]|uniref:Secreted protein n=1 Tax=Heterodera trifolii TaxID=157864 RepID=A0ABD2L8N4_9BILA